MEPNPKRNSQQLQLSFDDNVYENVFSNKNNKTLAETLSHRRYQSLKGIAEQKYESYLDMPLGSFALRLKQNGDHFYKRFLNKYGDAVYSQFWLTHPQDFMKKGVYFYFLNGEVVYVGRCKDNMKNRVNSGYRKVTPKNCFKDGQSTNCRLNSLITTVKDRISLQLYVLEDDAEIERFEKDLIRELNPIWNIRR